MSLSDILFSPQGRVPRSVSWYYFSALAVILVLLALLDGLLQSWMVERASDLTIFDCAYPLLILGALYPGVMISIKRAHDLDHSAWFVLLLAIPPLCFWALIEFAFLEGTHGDNPYGTDPIKRKLPLENSAA
jgi:uncharacterized membrane protein YhaH (DUF805 family)